MMSVSVLHVGRATVAALVSKSALLVALLSKLFDGVPVPVPRGL